MTDTEETKQCTNCKLDILSHNYIIHTVHCQRNYFLCSKCEQPVNYNNKSEHDTENHVTVFCKNCRLETEKWKLKKHLTDDCPYRKIKCQICDIEVKATEIDEHENYCGSRTEKCAECEEFVMLRYKSLHIDSNHTFIKLSDEPGPSPSWQYGKRTLYNFIPDFPSKNNKPLSSHRKRSGENRRPRTSDSSRVKNLEKINKKPETSENGEIEMNMESAHSSREKQKYLKKDDFSNLPNLSSLQISEARGEPSEASKPTHSIADEDSDLMYAIQFSKELNSNAWKKKSVIGSEETSRNSFLFPTPKEKPTEKNIFDSVEREKVVEGVAQKINSQDNTPKDSWSGRFEIQDQVKLPCEFCGMLIVSHYLFYHQSRCGLSGRDDFDRKNTTQKFSSFPKELDKKIPCGICNKFFRLSDLENHQIHCQKNLTKSWKNQEKKISGRSFKSMSVKPESGIQNGVEDSSPLVTRMGTRSEWLNEFSKNSGEEGSSFKNNLNQQQSKSKVTKVSRKSRRAPSPPKM